MQDITSILPVKYKLTYDAHAERTLLVSRYEDSNVRQDADGEEQAQDTTGRSLLVYNVPFFLQPQDLKLLFRKSSDIRLLDKVSGHKPSTGPQPLSSRFAVITYDAKVKLEKELKLIKHSIEVNVLYDTNAELAQNVLLDRCGLALLDTQFVKYRDDNQLNQLRAEVMESARKYNEEVLEAQKKKKRRFEREDDGWVKVVRK